MTVTKRPVPKRPAKGLKITSLRNKQSSQTDEEYEIRRYLWLKILAEDLGIRAEDWVYELAWRLGTDAYGTKDRPGAKEKYDLSEQFNLIMAWRRRERRGLSYMTIARLIAAKVPPYNKELSKALKTCAPNKREDLIQAGADRVRHQYESAVRRFRKSSE